MYLFFMHFLGYHLSNEENNGINPTTVKATYMEEMVSYSSRAWRVDEDSKDIKTHLLNTTLKWDVQANEISS